MEMCGIDAGAGAVG